LFIAFSLSESDMFSGNFLLIASLTLFLINFSIVSSAKVSRRPSLYYIIAKVAVSPTNSTKPYSQSVPTTLYGVIARSNLLSSHILSIIDKTYKVRIS